MKFREFLPTLLALSLSFAQAAFAADVTAAPKEHYQSTYLVVKRNTFVCGGSQSSGKIQAEEKCFLLTGSPSFDVVQEFQVSREICGAGLGNYHYETVTKVYYQCSQPTLPGRGGWAD